VTSNKELHPFEELDVPADDTIDDVVRAVARAPSRPLRPELVPGCCLKDRYVVERRVGAGAMGTVYEARDTLLDKKVAVKVLRPSADGDLEVNRKRIENEARLAARVEHERVARVYDFGEHEGSPFVVMEFAHGMTLRERMRSGRAEMRQVREIVTGIAEGLAALHERGVVHRDLKPENVMLVNECGVKLLDFGLARKVADASSSRSEVGPGAQAGTVESAGWSGTFGYIAPERFDKAPLGPQADIFALGVILYEFVTGSRPFEVHDVGAFLQAVKEGPDFSAGVWETFPQLRKLTTVMLSPDLDRRFADGTRVLRALRSGDPMVAAPDFAMTSPGPNVLWVDDRPEENAEVVAAFRAIQFVVVIETSTQAALDRMAHMGFDAVISSIPRAEGHRGGDVLLEWMRRRGDLTPFFVYSPSDEPEQTRDVLAHGGQGATSDSSELIALVDLAIRRMRDGDEPFISSAIAPRMSVVCADITRLVVDAIVNSTNETLSSSVGVSTAIHRAAGRALKVECRRLGGCAIGDAKLTKGHALAARFVIHTVGPFWEGGRAQEALLLTSCYARILELARRHALRTIAVPCISTGDRGYPVEAAAHIAVRSVARALAASPLPDRVIFCDIDSSSVATLARVLAKWTQA
jgi:serine/threonine protein kinase/O-acetyl-ADP-ribose deacetylase (regulator of RNase III)